MKHILITGTSKGIGEALLKEITAQSDATIYALSRNLPKADELVNATHIKYITCDLTDETCIHDAAAQVAQYTNTLDAVIHNAGYLVNKPFSTISSEDLDISWKVNFKGPYLLTQQLMPLLKRATASHVVLISSVGGVTGSSKFPGLSAYSSAKGALSILGECLAEEFVEDGIAVNVLALGSVQTEMLNAAFPGYVAQSTPEQMAAFIWKFTLEAHSVINGKTTQVGRVGV